jgi:16S rRNA (guanine1516-N2)-methyltransferase
MIEINSVGYEHDELQAKAQALAERLHCTLNKDSPQCLFVTDERLTLKIPTFSLMFADFSTKTWLKRKAEGKKQGMVRACKPVTGQKIIDATAGWGRDAAILASFGAEVLMLERNPIMATLLTDALARRSPTEQQEMKLSLHQENAFTFLSTLQPHEYPDVIYIDPMHPQRTKSALVKKDMQVLQDLIGPDEDALALIQLAMTRVKQRVVVKWPQKIKPLIPSTACVEGKTVRFDIYLALS